MMENLVEGKVDQNFDVKAHLNRNEGHLEGIKYKKFAYIVIFDETV